VTAVYEATIGHTRFVPFSRSFRHKATYWLTDVANLPRPPFGVRRLASFESRDHFDDPSRSIDENARAVLSGAGISMPGGRILMLAAPRYMGYVFNPLSVYWCYDAVGSLQAVIAEVHNTYGGRHNYVLPSAESSEVAKEFYVSPFITVAGTYTISAAEPAAGASVTIQLAQDGHPVFSAWLSGRRVASGSPWSPLLRHPLGSLRVAALIRMHGIILWLKRLPVIPRALAPRTEVQP